MGRCKYISRTGLVVPWVTVCYVSMIMKEELYEIFKALNDADVRYIVAGGLAVIAHGYIRLTSDVDLIIDLERENLLAGLKALETVGYVPRLPVSGEQFCDPDLRKFWIQEKNMLVFPLWKPSEANGLIVDVFVDYPFEFSAELANAKWMDTETGARIPFVGLDLLMQMKQNAARPKDLEDLRRLRAIEEDDDE